MVKKLSKDKKALAKFMKSVNEIEIKDEDMERLSLLIHEVYAKVVKKYINLQAVIQFNYLEDLKKRTKNCKTPKEFAKIVESDLTLMELKTNKTAIEQNEYLMAKKVYNDVVLGKGKEFEYGKDLTFKYDDQDIRFAGFFDVDKAQDQLKKLPN